MSLLKRINDKGAVIAWSPLQERPALLALGTKVCILLMYINIFYLNFLQQYLKLVNTNLICISMISSVYIVYPIGRWRWWF